MRWDGQVLGELASSSELDDFGEPASQLHTARVPRIGRAAKPGSAQELPGLEMRGLLRTVTTPEFEGIRFHEVASRSALNKVPGDSTMPFRWTVNPYRGCTHACVYCLDGDTRVLMADATQRPIRDLRVGDEIYGTERRGDYRRYVRTTVEAHWRTERAANRVALADGTELIASDNHRFLTRRGWKYVTGADCGTHSRPHLTLNDSLVGFGSKDAEVHPGDVAESWAGLDVVAVEPLGLTMPMFDITTGTGDFIANGVVSHNCFARGTHKYLELDTGRGFDSEIVVKTNIGPVLAAELKRRSWRREHVALGTNTDPYQRAEGRYRLMPGIIGALAASGTPFSILTKGTLLRRDIPLLKAAARDVPVGLGVSIAIWDDALHEALEPGTPSPKARLEMVKALAEAGLPCGVFMAPVLPGMTDTVDHLDKALGKLAEAGATGVMVLPLHLRPGAREWFLDWLAKTHPSMVRHYRRLYGRGSYVSPEYRKWLGERVKPILAAHGLDRSSGGELRSLDPEPTESAEGIPGDPNGRFPAGSLPEPGTPTGPPRTEMDQLTLL